MTRTREGATTVSLLGGLLDLDPVTGSTKRVYQFGGRAVMQRNIVGSVSTLHYLHGDHLGSVASVTNESGGVLSRQEYKPWGARRSADEVTQTTLDFTGQKKDDTGLLFYNAPLCVISTGWQ